MFKRLPGMNNVTLIVLLFIIVSPFSYCAAAGPAEKHILIMHAFTQDYPVHEAFNKGLKSKFQQNSQHKISYSYEYLDLAHFGNDEAYFAHTARYFQAKYAKRRPDMIVTSSMLARFLIKYGKDIFPGLPVLLVWNADDVPIVNIPADYFVIPEGFDAKVLFEKNIELILKTRPFIQRIHIVVGDSHEERVIVEEITPLTVRYAQRVNFVFLNKLPYGQMMEEIRNINDDSTILFLRWVNDVDGKNFVPAQVLQTICREAKVPVYGSAAHLFGAGTLGGYVFNYEISGQNVAEVGSDILNGKKKSDISVQTVSPNEYVFDWRELKRWGIDEAGVPQGSRIEYREHSIWELYKGYIIGGIVLLFLETLLVLGLLINRRERKKAYITIEKMSSRLKEQDKLKDIFLSNTSHEFKTPLHGIINIAQTVLEETADKITPRQTEDLSLIVALARRLSTLVNDILDFERIKNNEINLQIKAVDLRSAADTVLEVFRHIVKNNQVSLVNRIPICLPPVRADENRLRQVFYNLIGNAVKFNAKGEVIVTATLKEDMLHVSVSDTGIGIPPEKHEDIFLSFEQVSVGRAEAYGGSGLGLAITRQLVERMGGNIWVAWSEVDKGSEITFTLPAGDSGSAAEVGSTVLLDTPSAITCPPETGLRTVKKGEFTILAVDDDPANLRVMINIFAREDYDILTATNGVEALWLIHKNRKIDIVLLDVMMPGMTGYEVCRRLREEYSLFELPVLIVTVRDRRDDIAAGFGAGANDYIVKPFDADEIRARVRTLLTLKKAVGDAVRAEIAFLQSQIKPHFLYNVLNTIISFCYTDSAKAGKLLAEFSNYLRRSFDIQSTVSFTKLENELELVKSYVAIEQARFGDRLVVRYEIDPGLLNREIPPLVIQPLVENAVRHGLMCREEGGHIQVTARREDNLMIIEVTDDGVGISADVLERLPRSEKTTGNVGLRNINGRLLKFYGTKLSVTSKEGKGATVAMKIPLVSPGLVRNYPA